MTDVFGRPGPVPVADPPGPIRLAVGNGRVEMSIGGRPIDLKLVQEIRIRIDAESMLARVDIGVYATEATFASDTFDLGGHLVPLPGGGCGWDLANCRTVTVPTVGVLEAALADPPPAPDGDLLAAVDAWRSRHDKGFLFSMTARESLGKSGFTRDALLGVVESFRATFGREATEVWLPPAWSEEMSRWYGDEGGPVTAFGCRIVRDSPYFLVA